MKEVNKTFHWSSCDGRFFGLAFALQQVGGDASDNNSTDRQNALSFFLSFRLTQSPNRVLCKCYSSNVLNILTGERRVDADVRARHELVGEQRFADFGRAEHEDGVTRRTKRRIARRATVPRVLLLGARTKRRSTRMRMA